MPKDWRVWALLVAGVAAAAVLVKFLTKIREGAEKVGDTIAAPIASVLAPVIVGRPVRVNASIRLPDGAVIDANEVAIKDDFSFKYNGRMYRLGPRGTDNIYSSVLI